MKLVLIDSSCAAYQIGSIADKSGGDWDTIARLIDCYDQNGGLLNRSEEITVIWCFDSKQESNGIIGYWRHHLLKEIGVDYKPNRPDNPGINRIKQTISNRIPLDRQARQPGFEADDLMANLTQQYSDVEVDLVTVDTDLMQLIDDRIRWVNTAPYPPIIRGVEETKAYCLKKWKTQIESPRDIVSIKSRKGDPADGLPSGIDPGFIDLLNPIIRCPYWHSFDLVKQTPPGNTSGVYVYSQSAPLLEPIVLM